MAQKSLAVFTEEYLPLGFWHLDEAQELHFRPGPAQAATASEIDANIPRPWQQLAEKFGEAVCSLEPAGEQAHPEPLWPLLRFFRAKGLQAHLIQPELETALELLQNLPGQAERREALSYLLYADPGQAQEVAGVLQDMQELAHCNVKIPK